VEARVVRSCTTEDGLVNWPPEDLPPAQVAPSIRAQWCHGAPGIVSTLGDLMPLELATGAGGADLARGAAAQGAQGCATAPVATGSRSCGVAIYLRACLEADSQFPILDTF